MTRRTMFTQCTPEWTRGCALLGYLLYHLENFVREIHAEDTAWDCAAIHSRNLFTP